MTFNQKSDVKNHLSARRHKTVLPFRPTVQPQISNSLKDEPRGENRDIQPLRQKSGLEFYAVTPMAPPEIFPSPSNAADEQRVTKPQP
jgi:hypothetical protein